MPTISTSTLTLLLFALGSAQTTYGHLCPWHKGMYCMNDPADPTNNNNNAPVNPLYQYPFAKWFLHAYNGCDKMPPPDGEFMELEAGGSFSTEIATNRAQTSFSYGGQYAGNWPFGGNQSEPYGTPNVCTPDGVLHTFTEDSATGTAFAIAYQSDITALTLEDFVVFTTVPKTPWRRHITYDIPPDMPACPEGGCHCAWGWIPGFCGTDNMYMALSRCRVNNATSTKRLAKPVPPVYCGDNAGNCVQGNKQFMAYNELDGNNVQASGSNHPAYNNRWGFISGAQKLTFEDDGLSMSPAPSLSAIATQSSIPTVPSSATVSSSSVMATSGDTPSSGQPIELPISSSAMSSIVASDVSSPLVTTSLAYPAQSSTSSADSGQCSHRQRRRRIHSAD